MEEWKHIIHHQEKIIQSQAQIIERLEKENKKLSSILGQIESQLMPQQETSKQQEVTRVDPVSAEPPVPPTSVETQAAPVSQQPPLARRMGFSVHVPPPEEEEDDDDTRQVERVEVPQQESPPDRKVHQQDPFVTQIPVMEKVLAVRGIEAVKITGQNPAEVSTTWSASRDGYTLFTDSSRQQIAVVKYETPDSATQEESIFFFTNARLGEYFSKQLNLPQLTVATVLRWHLEQSATLQKVPITLVDSTDKGITYNKL